MSEKTATEIIMKNQAVTRARAAAHNWKRYATVDEVEAFTAGAFWCMEVVKEGFDLKPKGDLDPAMVESVLRELKML